jgi:hypothetical protein
VPRADRWRVWRNCRAFVFNGVDIFLTHGNDFRFDFNFIILRLDLAFPLRKPYLPEGERWVINEIDFGSSSWRHDNIVWNFAIGYPF